MATVSMKTPGSKYTTLQAGTVVALLCLILDSVSGHGRMLFPTQRSSLFRVEKYRALLAPNSANYDDMQLWCGGFERQWRENDGKCGVCGDPFDAERENEAGGKYAQGIIAETFSEGQTVGVNVQLTVYHKGYFTFKLCPNNNVNRRVTQACMDEHPLELSDGSGYKFYPEEMEGGAGTYTVNVKLPPGLTCAQCVVQWLYNTGNSWGTDFETGEMCVGCGAQEQFINCADVTITSRDGTRTSGLQRPAEPRAPPVVPRTRPIIETRPKTTPKPPNMEKIPMEQRGGPCPNGISVGRYAGLADFQSYCRTFCGLGVCPRLYCDCPGRTTKAPPSGTEPAPNAAVTESAPAAAVTEPKPQTAPTTKPDGIVDSNQSPRTPAAVGPRSTLKPTFSQTRRQRPFCFGPQPRFNLLRSIGRVAYIYCYRYCTRHPERCPNSVCYCARRVGISKPSEQTRVASLTTPRPLTRQRGDVISRATPRPRVNQPCVGRPTQQYTRFKGYDAYCRERCTRAECPKECVCDSDPDLVAESRSCTGQAINDFAKTKGAEQWCVRFCRRGSCPYTTHCRLPSGCQA